MPAIRHRLAVTEDLPTNLDNGSKLYDEELEEAVHRFQKRHRLPIGDLASKTLAAMNVPVKARIDQIRVNMERTRWITRDVKPTQVVVNIAAARELGGTAALVQVDEQPYLLKPMNCPHHCRIYASDLHSYKELPIRFAEFGTVYRYEQSGELHGLTRVRGFTQDDAHLFVMPYQLEDVPCRFM